MMKPCLGFQQLRLIFGFAVSLMVNAGNVSAAPRCADVMLESIKPTLQDLAQFKLNLDSQVVDNGQTGRSLAINQQTFNLKLNEFKTAFNGIYSDKQIVAMIKEEIASIQKVNAKEFESGRKERAKAQKDRTKEELIFKTYEGEYALTDTLTLSRKPQRREKHHRTHNIEYVPKLDALFILEETMDYDAKKGITLLDIRNNFRPV